MQKISFIVPCYSEELVLPKWFERLESVAGTRRLVYEIICMNDGSHGHTWELLKARNKVEARAVI